MHISSKDLFVFQFNALNALLTEVNIDYTYKDCTLIDKLDNLLELNGFKKINQYIWTDHTYGDAIYIKSNLIV